MQCMILPAQLAAYSHYEVWDEITYPVPNFNGATIEIWEWIGNFTHTLLGTRLVIHAEITLNPC